MFHFSSEVKMEGPQKVGSEKLTRRN